MTVLGEHEFMNKLTWVSRKTIIARFFPTGYATHRLHKPRTFSSMWRCVAVRKEKWKKIIYMETFPRSHTKFANGLILFCVFFYRKKSQWSWRRHKVLPHSVLCATLTTSAEVWILQEEWEFLVIYNRRPELIAIHYRSCRISYCVLDFFKKQKIVHWIYFFMGREKWKFSVDERKIDRENVYDITMENCIFSFPSSYLTHIFISIFIFYSIIDPSSIDFYCEICEIGKCVFHLNIFQLPEDKKLWTIWEFSYKMCCTSEGNP